MRLIIIFCLLFQIVYADSPDGGMVILPSQEVHEGDFFAWGRSIDISGTVNGDVYLIGAQIHIDGVVNGSVLAIGGSIDIDGHVTKSCRLMGGQILVSGKIDDSLSCLCGNLQTISTGYLAGNVVVTAGNIDLAAPIAGTATVMAANVRESATIQHDLQGYVGKMRITSKAVIHGDLDYKSSSPAVIDNGAQIRGEVIYHPSLVHHLLDTSWIHQLFVGSQVIITLMNFIYTLAMCWLISRFFPSSLREAATYLSSHAWKSLGYGLLFVIVMPLIVLLLFATVLGVPLALTVMAFNVLGFYTGKIYALFWLSDKVISKWKFKKLWPFFIGFTVVYFGVTALPFIGPAIALVTLLFGLGSALLSQMKKGFVFRN